MNIVALVIQGDVDAKKGIPGGTMVNVYLSEVSA